MFWDACGSQHPLLCSAIVISISYVTIKSVKVFKMFIYDEGEYLRGVKIQVGMKEKEWVPSRHQLKLTGQVGLSAALRAAFLDITCLV